MISQVEVQGRGLSWPESFRQAVAELDVTMCELAKLIGDDISAVSLRQWYCGRSRPRKNKSREALKAFFGWSDVELPPRNPNPCNCGLMPGDFPNHRDLSMMDLLHFCGSRREKYYGPAAKSENASGLIASHTSRIAIEESLHQQLKRASAAEGHPASRADVMAANLIDKYRGSLDKLANWLRHREQGACV